MSIDIGTVLCGDEVIHYITRKTSETDKNHLTSEVNQGWRKGGDLGKHAETITFHDIDNIESSIELLNNASQPRCSIYDANENWEAHSDVIISIIMLN